LETHPYRLTITEVDAAIAWCFRRPSMARQMVGLARLISLAKALFQPSHTLLVRDPFFSVMSWTFQSSGVNVGGDRCILMDGTMPSDYIGGYDHTIYKYY